MYANNKLQIGLFGANCSSGRAVTLVPERWSGSWPDCKRLAQMADEAGIDFMLPIGRWKGYGGDTDYQGTTLETITWATGLLGCTKHITVFGTVHAPDLQSGGGGEGDGHRRSHRRGPLRAQHRGRLERRRVRHVRRRRRPARRPLRLRPGMDRRHQDDLVRQGEFRLQGQASRHEGRARQAETLRRRAAADHECRRLADRPGLRDQATATRSSCRPRAPRWRRRKARCAPRRTRRARKTARSAATPSASSPAGRPRRKPRSISTTASSSTPTGRRSTAFWR